MPRSRSLLLVATLAAWGCIGWPTEDDFKNLDLCPSVASVHIDPPSLDLRVGDDVQLVAWGVDGDQLNLLCPEPAWSSSNSAAATVSALGVVTGVGPGVTYIRASIKGKIDSVLVTMSTAAIASVAIVPNPNNLLVGQTQLLSVAARDADGHLLPVRRVSWSSSDRSVVTVSVVGMLTAVDAGDATVEALVEGKRVSLPVTATRNAPTIKFQQISPGTQHTCALVGGGALASGTAYCWGAAYDGQLGTGDVERRPTPTRVATDLAFETISAEGDHTCANTASGVVYCWGWNGWGQIGDGTTTDRLVPTRVHVTVPLHDVVSSAASSCGLAADGSVYCWGSWGNRVRSAPTALAGGLKFVQLSGGSLFACGLTAEGRVYCWGSFLEHNADAPELASGDILFSAIDAGSITLCGLGIDHSVYCWGQNTGFFWDPAISRRTLPVLVPGGSSFDAIATGGGFVCALAGLETYCLGIIVGTPGSAFSLVRVPRGEEHAFAQLSGGGRHGCAIDVVGGGWCWGGNDETQVGVGENVYTGQPLQLRIN